MEVNVSSLYKITMIESESGYGQRPMGTKFVTTEQEAKQFCNEYAGGDSNTYYRATYQKIA